MCNNATWRWLICRMTTVCFATKYKLIRKYQTITANCNGCCNLCLFFSNSYNFNAFRTFLCTCSLYRRNKLRISFIGSNLKTLWNMIFCDEICSNVNIISFFVSKSIGVSSLIFVVATRDDKSCRLKNRPHHDWPNVATLLRLVP